LNSFRSRNEDNRVKFQRKNPGFIHKIEIEEIGSRRNGEEKKEKEREKNDDGNKK